MKKLSFIFLFCLSLLLIGCEEAKEGADAVSSKITGEQDVETMIKTENKLKELQEKTNKQQQDALNQLQK